eukprot:1156631-Pelagomonas_calceolata.AAC.2
MLLWSHMRAHCSWWLTTSHLSPAAWLARWALLCLFFTNTHAAVVTHGSALQLVSHIAPAITSSREGKCQAVVVGRDAARVCFQSELLDVSRGPVTQLSAATNLTSVVVCGKHWQLHCELMIACRCCSGPREGRWHMAIKLSSGNSLVIMHGWDWQNSCELMLTCRCCSGPRAGRWHRAIKLSSGNLLVLAWDVHELKIEEATNRATSFVGLHARLCMHGCCCWTCTALESEEAGGNQQTELQLLIRSHAWLQWPCGYAGAAEGHAQTCNQRRLVATSK